MKRFVATHNVTFKPAHVKQIIEDAIVSVSVADSAACNRYVQAVEQSYWETSMTVDEEIEKFIIEVTSSDEDTDSASECTDYLDPDTAEEY